MVWCISVCSYDVDVDLLFQENSSIGQKMFVLALCIHSHVFSLAAVHVNGFKQVPKIIWQEAALPSSHPSWWQMDSSDINPNLIHCSFDPHELRVSTQTAS